MRFGFAVSAVGHALIVLAGILALANPRPMRDVLTPPVTVDIVPQDEIASAKDKKTDLSSDAEADGHTGQPAHAPARADVPDQADIQPDTPAAGLPHQASDDRSTQVAAPWPLRGSSPQPDPFTANTEPLFIPYLQGLDQGGGGEFDARANTAAKLTQEEVAAFRAQVQKCWKAPAGMADARRLQAVLRISLTPKGVLAKEPLLVEASASTFGPKLVETATRALRQCQPFTFLPAEKYDEWKVLDLSFSPYGLAGG
jgi:hypothetical protein